MIGLFCLVVLSALVRKLKPSIMLEFDPNIKVTKNYCKIRKIVEHNQLKFEIGKKL